MGIHLPPLPQQPPSAWWEFVQAIRETLAALRWARRPIAGASALLEQVPGRGDKAFDYLTSDAARREAVKEPIWRILLRHATPQTLITIGHAAARAAQADVVQVCLDRLDDEQQAADLLRRSGDKAELARRAGGPHNSPPLIPGYRDEFAALLAERDDIEELTRRADEGDWSSCKELARLLVERREYDELERRVDRGDIPAEQALLDQERDVAKLTRRAQSSIAARYAHHCLIKLLAELNDVERLAQLADDGDDNAAHHLSWLLKRKGDEDELARRAATDKHAAERLAWLRIERMSDAELRTAWEEEADPRVADAYVQRLFSRGDETGLAELADPEGRWCSQLACWRLADLLYEHGDRHELARRADAGDGGAAEKLAKLLAECGEEDELAHRKADGDWHAEIELDKLLAARGRRRVT
ncbi:MAG: hypothetical protein ACRDS0_19290 [Pseudonocardiaceae bacterium]